MWPLYCYKKDTTKQKFTRKCRQIIHNCYCRNFTLSLIWFLFIIILLFKEFIDKCYSYFACNVEKPFKRSYLLKKLNRIYRSDSTKLLLIVYHCPMAITFFEVIMIIIITLSFTYTDCDYWRRKIQLSLLNFCLFGPSVYLLWFVVELCLDPLRYIKKGIL